MFEDQFHGKTHPSLMCSGGGQQPSPQTDQRPETQSWTLQHVVTQGVWTKGIFTVSWFFCNLQHKQNGKLWRGHCLSGAKGTIFCAPFLPLERHLHFHRVSWPLHCFCRGFTITSLSGSGWKSKWRMGESEYSQGDGQWKTADQSVLEIQSGDGPKPVGSRVLTPGREPHRH